MRGCSKIDQRLLEPFLLSSGVGLWLCVRQSRVQGSDALMAKIRVLVIDDSMVIRKVVCEALATDASIEVAGTAADGTIGL